MSAFVDSFSYKLIYIFAVPSDTHEGLLKIGDATIKTSKSIDELRPGCSELNKAAKDRIKQYTTTVGVSFTLLHTELAVREVTDKNGNIKLKAFRDHNVHRVLENSGYSKKTSKRYK